MDDIEKTGDMFANSVLEVVSMVSGFEIYLISKKRSENIDNIAAGIALVGNKTGVLMLFAGEESLTTLCSYMTGVERKDVKRDDLDDTISELANMVAGRAKIRINDKNDVFAIGLPFVISGENMYVTTKKRTKRVSRRFGNDEISIGMELIY